MSSSGNGGCISFVLWNIISAIVVAITDSVFAGIVSGETAILPLPIH
mgnify:CR=1 FL=1